MLEMRREAVRALQVFHGRVTGALQIGGSTIPGTYILPGIMARFRRRYPETRLALAGGDSRAVAKLLVEGRIELGVVGAVEDRSDLEFTPLFRDRMVLAVPPDHEWARRRNGIGAKDLAGAPFILREPGSGTRRSMLRALDARGAALRDLDAVAEMSGTEAVRQAVKAGLGVSILSRVAVAEDESAGLLKIVPVRGLDLDRRFYLAANPHRTLSPVGEAFKKHLLAEAEED
jgi:DNA-binding transcriptional LysR family regulator